MLRKLFRCKPLGFAHEHAVPLKRCLTATDLTFMGIGAVIGAGIFILTGIAAATRSGPAIILSFIIAGIACTFSALSYAELAVSIGGCGSAYGYAFAGLGEFVAWIIGWDLILEYAISVSAVANGWGGYANHILTSLGIPIADHWLKGPFEGGYCNVLALIVVLTISVCLSIGVKTSARFNFAIVIVKLSVIGLFVVLAVQHIQPHYWHPFMPFGWSGMMSGAALVFFAFVGFDAVSTTAEEAINPNRTLPIGIMTSLLVCTLVYVLVSALLTGIVPYTELNTTSSLSQALLRYGYQISSSIIAVGALAGLTTVILVMYYGLTRVFLAMSRDRLLPKFFSQVNSRTHTPVRIILSSGVVMAILSALMPMSALAELVNIGTLTAFIIVCLGVIVMRYTKPDMVRTFKVPFAPLTPFLGVAFSLYLTFSLPLVTWIRFGVWMLIGLLIYFTYSRFHSILSKNNLRENFKSS